MTNKKSFFVFLLLLLLSTTYIHSQDFQYKKVPVAYGKLHSKNNFQYETKKIVATAYYLINSLPKDCDKFAKTDYTEIIQSVIDNNRIVVFPDFPLLINSKGLTVSSDSKLIFKKKSKLIIEPNDKTNYEVLRLHKVKNVSIYFPTIIGDRNSHIGSKGEWGMGISIIGSQFITIIRPFITDCWGDGIYLGSDEITNKNKNISINDAYLDNNRRNGISIISAEDLQIKNPLISNTNGTSPMSGIDLEPNTNYNELQNISIINPITFNNGKRGILFAFNNLYGTNKKQIKVNVKNHIDDASPFAMGFSLSQQKNDNSQYKIDGVINIENPIWKNNTKEPVQYYELSNNSIKVNFKKLKIINGKNYNKLKIKELKQKYTNESFNFIN